MSAELPPALALAIDEAVAEISPRDLQRASLRLSERYRERRPHAAPVARSAADILAYAATRLPATYAAIGACCGALRERRPDWRPRTLLDLGAGPGTGLWAAAGAWPGLEAATALEGEPAMVALGQRLARASSQRAVAGADWRRGPLPAALPGGPFDLVLLGYVLGELPTAGRDQTVEAALSATAADGLLLIVEPGTPDGYARVLAARDRLIAAGGSVAAPCPHDGACPLAGHDWCHFAVRLPRTAAHRTLKQGELGYEDEKFSYVAVGRRPTAPAGARIIRHPQTRPRLVELQLCTSDGLRTIAVPKGDRDRFRLARKAAWGDPFPWPG